MDKAITSANWHTIPLTGIVLRQAADFMTVIILPCEGPDGPCWRRFSHQLLRWSTHDTNEVVNEVDAGWNDPKITVEILTHDLPLTDGQFDPFTLYYRMEGAP